MLTGLVNIEACEDCGSCYHVEVTRHCPVCALRREIRSLQNNITYSTTYISSQYISKGENDSE